MGNEKKGQNINYFFSFPIKTFFNWIVNQCPMALVNMTLVEISL